MFAQEVQLLQACVPQLRAVALSSGSYSCGKVAQSPEVSTKPLINQAKRSETVKQTKVPNSSQPGLQLSPDKRNSGSAQATRRRTTQQSTESLSAAVHQQALGSQAALPLAEGSHACPARRTDTVLRPAQEGQRRSTHRRSQHGGGFQHKGHRTHVKGENDIKMQTAR